MGSRTFKPPLIRVTPKGLYCQAGDFYIDPWRKVERALVTHGHSDHARWGMGAYLTAEPGVGVVRERVGREAKIEGLPFGERRKIGGVEVSFHPAGHLLGSGQIRVAQSGEVWVVTGDYKVSPDISCESFEPIRCNTLITEATFGLPVYRWPDSAEVFRQINDWWRSNQAQGRTSILFAYALGKAQRALCGLDRDIGPIGVHGAVAKLNPHYRAAGRPLPETLHAKAETQSILCRKGLIVAPGSAQNTPWIRRFAPYSLGFASGWMAVRGARRRRAVDRGFVLSDHVDWPGILQTIEASGASRVGVTHGYAAPLIRWLRERQGLDAFEVPTRFPGASGPDGESEDESGG
ncbi:MAG: ligase-associated DNA damage response exonuclease [Opitutales bacterium]